MVAWVRLGVRLKTDRSIRETECVVSLGEKKGLRMRPTFLGCEETVGRWSHLLGKKTLEKEPAWGEIRA